MGRTLLMLPPTLRFDVSSRVPAAKASRIADVHIVLERLRWDTGSRQLISWMTPQVARRVDVLLRNGEFESAFDCVDRKTWILAFGFPQDRHSTDFVCDVDVPRGLHPGKYFVHLQEVMS